MNKRWTIGIVFLVVLMCATVGCSVDHGQKGDTPIRSGGNIEPVDVFDVTVSWANYTDSDVLNSAALNAATDGAHRLPIVKLETRAELERFKADFADTFTMDHGYDEIPSFESVTASMDDAYFQQYTVLLVYVTATSGSLRFGVDSVSKDGETLCVHIRQTNAPETGTCDMAGWFLTVSLEKDMLKTVTAFDAELV